ncbi:MAG: hypothetical protein HKO65_18190, partial [Gemmatimonadetes bacterium]|nr:hypothetical protein [Gemmatimonadota bacterium]
MPRLPLGERLKQRKVVQRGLAYLAGAFVVFQAVEVMAEPWGISPSIQRTIHVLLLTGFFVQLVIAWYHGEKGRQQVSGPELLILATLMVIAGGVLKALGGRPDSANIVGGPGIGDRPSIAVLPCENMSPDPNDEHLASGLHDEILLKLQKISSLLSIGRTSVLQFSEAPPAVNEIAAALGVRHVGECSVRKEGDRIRLTFQLLDGETGGQVWANNYDRDLTVGNLLDIESDIAQQVAQAIGAVLTPEERAEIDAVPTENLAAYEAYLRPISAEFQGYDEDDLRYLVRMYQRAVELDPGFGLAYAKLARAHSEMYWFTFDRSEERRMVAQEALDSAMALAPDHAEVHLAAGSLHY